MNGAMLRTVSLMAGAALLAIGGCARPYGVPPFTQLVAEAPGQAASFRAPDEGTVWVAGPGTPLQARHIVYSGLVRRGDIVTVDPGQRELLVEGKPADVAIEGGRSFYQVWFQPVRHDLLAN